MPLSLCLSCLRLNVYELTFGQFHYQSVQVSGLSNRNEPVFIYSLIVGC